VGRPRLRLIVNPVASSVGERTVRTALRALEPHCDVELLETQRRGHAIELAAEAVASGFDGIGVMGGDGTANEVLNGAGSALPIGVLPGGGTNVLSRALGLSPHRAGGGQIGRRAVGPTQRQPRRQRRRFAFASGVGADAQPCASDSAGRPGRRRATPTSRRRSCGRCCAASTASAARRVPGRRIRRARREHLRRQRASQAMSAFRSSWRARDVRADSTWWCQ
jgi:hypothetical protein